MKTFMRLVVLALIVAVIFAVLHHSATPTQQTQQPKPNITTPNRGDAMRAYMEEIRSGIAPCLIGLVAISQIAQGIKDGTASIDDLQSKADTLTGSCDTATSTMDGTAIPSALTSSHTFQHYLTLMKRGMVLDDQAMYDIAAIDTTNPDMNALSHGADETARASALFEQANVLYNTMQHAWHFTIPMVSG